MTLPEEVGLSSERLKRIGDVMQRYVDEQKVAGFITMIARRGRVVHAECFGMMDREAGKAMQLDTIFRLYSMTKALTSVAVMMLYERGHFQLYDSIADFLPAFRAPKVYASAPKRGYALVDAARDISFRDLLTHTAGLTYDFLDDSPVGTMYKKANLGNATSQKEFAEMLAELPLAFHPGSGWKYSVATDLLGYLVEVISGMPFDVYMEEYILKPLGMVDTTFYVPEEKAGRFAAMYGPADEGGLKLIDAPQGSTFTKPPSRPAGGHGLVGTASDYMRFLQMMLNGGEVDGVRLLGRKTVELMTTNHLPVHCLPMMLSKELEYYSRGYGFGLGFDVLMDVAQSQTVGSVGEHGWGGAAGTDFWIDPKEGLIGLFMTQFQPTFHYPLHTQFKVLTYQALVG